MHIALQRHDTTYDHRDDITRRISSFCSVIASLRKGRHTALLSVNVSFVIIIDIVQTYTCHVPIPATHLSMRPASFRVTPCLMLASLQWIS
jgi:hypothetical protein